MPAEDGEEMEVGSQFFKESIPSSLSSHSSLDGGMTIFEALTTGAEKLKATQHEKLQSPGSPKLDAQVLLSFVLSKPSSFLFAHGDDAVEAQSLERYLAFIERRAKHEPIAYITGEKEFFKRPFMVTPATLIPRPDTEVLVEEALKAAKPDSVFLDIGTGSGAIAITLAAESSSGVFATDISTEALDVAVQNANKLGVADRVIFLHGDLLKPFIEKLKEWKDKASIPSLVITANLPYIARRQYEGLDPDVLNFEPKSALLAGIDGLDLYDQLLDELYESRALFPADLQLLIEIDPSQAFSAERLIKHYFPRASISLIADLSRQPRLLVATIPTRS
jgi:release factor glutamine methyltransferase